MKMIFQHWLCLVSLCAANEAFAQNRQAIVTGGDVPPPAGGAVVVGGGPQTPAAATTAAITNAFQAAGQGAPAVASNVTNGSSNSAVFQTNSLPGSANPMNNRPINPGIPIRRTLPPRGVR